MLHYGHTAKLQLGSERSELESIAEEVTHADDQLTDELRATIRATAKPPLAPETIRDLNIVAVKTAALRDPDLADEQAIEPRAERQDTTKRVDTERRNFGSSAQLDSNGS